MIEMFFKPQLAEHKCHHLIYYEKHILIWLRVMYWSGIGKMSHLHGPLARYVKLWVVHAPGMQGTFSPPSRVSDPNMHHGTYVTHVLLCTPGTLAISIEIGGGENVPGISGISGACATHNFTCLVRGPWGFHAKPVPSFVRLLHFLGQRLNMVLYSQITEIGGNTSKPLYQTWECALFVIESFAFEFQ